MKKEEVRARIEEIGIVPAVRLHSAEEARFAIEAILRGGIPIVEITMTVPGAIDVIADLVHHHPKLLVGAGTLFDTQTAQKCLDAGAHFLTNPGFDQELVEFALKKNVAMLSGALTPTEITRAWKAGADFVKVFPCGQFGGESYMRALKRPFRDVPLIAAGGVNQQTAVDYILAGAAAIGVGNELIPEESIRLRQPHRIHELAKRFVGFVHNARARMAAVHKRA
jgi:2-dehydro-3-deoxyphosphogluconate aldolase / (4S)-4-hydroxy-2-oxoglutarate aldolase